MPEEIKHLYELIDKELVLEGLRRLLYAIDEQITLAENAIDLEESSTIRPSNGKLLIFGTDWTARYNTLYESRQLLDEACSILAALALPRNYDDLDSHVRNAFFAIDMLLRGSRHLPYDRIAVNKIDTPASGTPREAEDNSVSQTSSGTCANDTQQGTNKAPQSDRSPESPLPPYVEFLVNLTPELGKTAPKMKKDEVRDDIKQRWDSDALGDPSAHLLDLMATLLRPPEAQKGGAKPKP
jgi:hypothetical protein